MIGQFEPPRQSGDWHPFDTGQRVIVIDPESPHFNQIGVVFRLTTTGILLKDNRNSLLDFQISQVKIFEDY